MPAPRHKPVLLKELLSAMSGTEARRFVDGTVGYGGHAEALLRLFPCAELLGIDRDVEALQFCRGRLGPFEGRVHLAQGPFSGMRDYLDDVGWQTVDGVLLDLGVSSPQLDTPQRGFSHREDGPLDMRMDRGSETTAATILNTYTEEDLADIFRRYGEERRARAVAKAVVARRADRPWARTGELADLLENTVGGRHRTGLPPATRCFQALRIAVNDELGELERGLRAAVDVLAPGGRLAVISFHSLEDRIVKHFMKHEAASCICPPDFPVCRCGKIATLEVLTRKPIRPSDDEVEQNRRSASAKMRVAQKRDTTARESGRSATA